MKFSLGKKPAEAEQATGGAKAQKQGGDKVVEREQRPQGIGVGGNALLRAWIVAAAIVVVTAVALAAYLQLVREPGQQRDVLAQVASNYAQGAARSVGDAVAGLQRRVDAAVSSPLALDAPEVKSPVEVDAAEQALGSFFPEALSVRLLPLDDMGTTNLDSGEELRNHIEVDLVRRAANDTGSRPEAYQVDGNWLLSIAAMATRPEQETQRAVLLVTLTAAEMARWISAGDTLPGQFKLQQRVNSAGGVLDVDILSLGSAAAGSVAQTAAAADTGFKVVFQPGSALVEGVRSSARSDIDLLLLLALLAVAGTLLALRRSSSAINEDLQRILEGATQRKRLDVRVPALAPVARELRKLSLRNARSDVQGSAASGAPAATAGQLGPVEGPAAAELPGHIFRAYDIRGIADSELSNDTVFRIAAAVGTLALEMGEKTLLLAHDGRTSSKRIRDVVEKALLECGCDVINIGLVPTPLLYFATHKLAAQSGIMVTGSHNPADFNGMKIVLRRETVSDGTIAKIRALAQRGAFSKGAGNATQQDMVSDYLDEIVADVAMAVPLKIVIDAGNGATGQVAPALLEELGCEVVPLHCDIDGRFPNHGPDTGNDDNLKDLVNAVLSSKADFGVAYDGDGDRLVVVTGNGSILRTDRLMMLFARDVVGRNPGADVVYDVKCSRILAQLITRLGGRPVLWKTGHALMKQKMVETGALLGGEFSGHVFFGERWFGFDDGMYATARLAEIVSSQEGDLDDLLSDLPTSVSTPEMLIPISEQEKFATAQRFVAEAEFDSGQRNDLDGLRVDFEDGWGLLRASNTSAALTTRFEANNEVALQRIMGQFREQLATIAPDLEIPF